METKTIKEFVERNIEIVKANLKSGTIEEFNCNEDYTELEGEDPRFIGEIISNGSNGIYQVRDAIGYLTDLLGIEEYDPEITTKSGKINIHYEWIHEVLEEFETKVTDEIEKIPEFSEIGVSFGNSDGFGDYVVFISIPEKLLN